MISRSWRCINSSNGGGRHEFSSAITPFYAPHEGKCERFAKQARFYAGVSIRRRSLRLQIEIRHSEKSVRPAERSHNRTTAVFQEAKERIDKGGRWRCFPRSRRWLLGALLPQYWREWLWIF